MLARYPPDVQRTRTRRRLTVLCKILQDNEDVPV
jgi:hypothetical protein